MIAVITTCCVIMALCLLFGAGVLGYQLYEDWKFKNQPPAPVRRYGSDTEFLTAMREELSQKYNPLAVDECGSFGFKDGDHSK